MNINETFSVAESAGTDTFTVTDEDAFQDDNLPPDFLLGVAWLGLRDDDVRQAEPIAGARRLRRYG